ncbi:iron complex transport system substrate-binding protein [Bacillus mesophilus]|uniref:Iron-siderophore ABC transporter substrate-binding protein n=1 Tax=Bacillus mesophilus TaxID=1808955 RepID=A0A6M0QEU2_9BACI|nr:iron complex transport system substrate-binding protein [Bacillus mesophilus]NEY73848.1 iron-siderophore ABC transporter substrate-binding protein [Bacillus mesophilus]
MSSITYFLGKKKLFSLIALLLCFSIFLVGCGNQAETTEETETETQSETTEETEASDVREITHALGTTTIEGTPKKIVTLYQGATDAAIAFGVTPVGAVNAWLPEDPKIYEYLKADLEGVTLVGDETQPNLEEIAKLKPDLIIASKLRHEEVYAQLSEIAPTVAHETVFMYKETVELMGQAMNQEEKAEEILANWDNRVADLSTKLQEKLGDKWPVNVSVLNFRPDHARIYNTGFAGSVLAEVGFTRPENQQIEDAVTMLNDKESITEMNADVFYIFNENDPAVQKTYEEWTSHPLWKNLDAVKANQVYEVDVVTWNMAGGILAANLMLDDIYDRFGLEK